MGNLLLIEDNLADQKLTMEAFREANAKVKVYPVSGGSEALLFLSGSGKYAHVPLPDLILLDLNLPQLSGREILQELKTHPVWKRIPVIVFSTSSFAIDVDKTYDLFANCFIIKPLTLEEYFQVIERVDRFWLRTAQLPERVRAFPTVA